MNKAKDIQEGNKLIAEFTERAIQEGDRMENRYWIILPGKELGQWVRESHLKYHSSWDWLMPVVEKIAEEHSLFSLVIGNVNCYAQFEDTPVRKGVEPKPIDAVWNHVVKFITWYNQNKTIYKTKFKMNKANNTGEWVSVEDRLPDYGHYIAAYFNPSDSIKKLYVLTAWRGRDGWYWDNSEKEKAEDSTLKITHWMPLPQKPE